MTVKELKDKLKNFPDDQHIVMYNNGYQYTYENLEEGDYEEDFPKTPFESLAVVEFNGILIIE